MGYVFSLVFILALEFSRLALSRDAAATGRIPRYRLDFSSIAYTARMYYCDLMSVTTILAMLEQKACRRH